MKKTSKIIILTVVMLVSLLVLASCSVWASPYEKLEKDGCDISVKYLAGGGVFASTNGITIVDVFNQDNLQDSDGGKKLSIIPPESDKRGNNAFDISRTGYALSGWFVAVPIEDGMNLDGKTLLGKKGARITNGSDAEACYYLSDKWDFDSDSVTIEAGKEYSVDEPVLTLAAYWLEYVNFEFYDGDTLLGTKTGLSMDIPEWNMETGKLSYKTFFSAEGKTVDIDSIKYQAWNGDTAVGELTPMTEKIEGVYDYEAGKCLTPTIKIYADWIDGEWFKISAAGQLRNINLLNGCYEILEDLDFKDVAWPSLFADGEFSGKIIGNGHKISNVEAFSKDSYATYGGLFGSLADTAKICDVEFENVTYTVDGSRFDATYGLISGAKNSAVIENVTVSSGKLILTSNLTNVLKDKLVNGEIKIGLLFGDGNSETVDCSAVTYVHEDPEATEAQVSHGEDGILIFNYPDEE